MHQKQRDMRASRVAGVRGGPGQQASLEFIFHRREKFRIFSSNVFQRREKLRVYCSRKGLTLTERVDPASPYNFAKVFEVCSFHAFMLFGFGVQVKGCGVKGLP